MKNVVVIGASSNPWRYSYKAVISLIKNGYSVYPIGSREGKIENTSIILNKPWINNVYAVLLYLNPLNQEEYFDYIIKLHPKKIIFNPGAENNNLFTLAVENNIDVLYDCALVLLATDSF